MVDEKTKAAIKDIGNKLALHLPGFYGKVTFNYQNGIYVNSNVEQSITNDKPKEGVKK